LHFVTIFNSFTDVANSPVSQAMSNCFIHTAGLTTVVCASRLATFVLEEQTTDYRLVKSLIYRNYSMRLLAVPI
jgi:hypothetical protein